ncbi:hypothetical protein ACFVTE_18700 [Arthrobacter sp. NPDC058097]|uniref:hypothetical protein n=1 Tax=Arthrobacter sp. NPDC058097 TaxID=3346340 RepID=UPI0036DFA39D
MNERIAFTSFTSRSVPAVVRWKEREAEVLASLPQPAHTPRHANLQDRHHPAGPGLQSQPVPAVQRLTRRLPGVAEPLTVWRLVSGNHRELGRGAGSFDTHAMAVTHAQFLINEANRLTVSFVRHAGTGKIGWYAGLESRPLLLAPSWYGTARDCERTAATALLALQDAAISGSVVKYGPRYDIDHSPMVQPVF